MYRIAVLAKTDQLTRSLADQIIRFYTRLGIFPQIERCWDQERFFSCVAGAAPTSAVIALPGVAGLNAVEHLRSLDPKCGIIWCSDLDFSLQAFRLRVDDFLMEPVSGEALQEALAAWYRRRQEYTARKKQQG